MKLFGMIACLMLLVSTATAAIQLKPVEYEHEGALLEGWIAYDDTISGKRPGILVVHEWTGVTDYVKKRAQMLAELGYAAFVADIYGKGVNPQPPREAGEMAGKFRNDPVLFRGRVNAALDVMKQQPQVNPDQVAAIGYCFGGGAVLELARSGADIDGVVSFHGSLATKQPAEPNTVKAEVLVLHGADDKAVSEVDVKAFHEEMKAAGIDYTFIAYSDAVHSFTNWNHKGAEATSNSRYNERADKQSWMHMQMFFNELFPEVRKASESKPTTRPASAPASRPAHSPAPSE